MLKESSKSNYFFTMLSKAVFGLLLLLLFGCAISYYLATSNSQFVVNQVIDRLEKKLHVNLGFSEYYFSATENFPFLSLELKDLFLEGSELHKDNLELLRIKKLSFSFDPVKLLQQQYSVNAIFVDGVNFHIYKDSSGNSNLNFLQNINSYNNKNTSTADIDFSTISIKDLDFDYTDDSQNKAFQIFFPNATLANHQAQNKKQLFQLIADCQFKGLSFSRKNGAFLKNKNGQIELNIEVDSSYALFKIAHSKLDIDKQIFEIKGQFNKGNNNHLTLNIQNDKTFLAFVLPLLSSNIQFALRDFAINKAIKVNFLLDGHLISGQNIPMQLDFSSQNTNLIYRGIKMTHAFFAGQYKNSCASHQPINANSASVKVMYLHGHLLGTMPAKFSGKLTNLNDPYVQLKANIDAELAALNELIPIEQKIDINQGNAKFNFVYEGPVKDLNISAFKRGKIKLNGALDFEDININLAQKDFALHDISGHAIFDQNSIQVHDIKTLFADSKMTLNGVLMNFTNFLFGKNKALEADLKLNFDQINIKDFLSPDTTKQDIYNSDKINKHLPGDQVSRLAMMLNNKLKGKLSVAVNTMLYDTLSIKDIRFDLNLDNPCTALTNCKPIISIPNFKAVFLDSIPFEANLLLDQVDDPMLHIDVKSAANLDQLTDWLPKDQVHLSGGFFDVKLNSNIRINSFSSSEKFFQDLKYKGDLQVEKVAANYLPKKIALKNLGGDFSFDEEKIVLHNCSFYHHQNQYNLQGKLYNYLPQLIGKDSIIMADLSLSTDSLNINNINTTNIYNNKHPNRTPSRFLQSLAPISKLVNGQLSINIDQLKTAKYRLNELHFNSIIDSRQDAQKAVFSITDFRAKLNNKIPFTAKLEFDHFEKTKIKTSIKSIIPVKELGLILPSDYFSFYRGNLILNIDYTGDLSEAATAENYFLKADIDGTIKFFDAHIDYDQRGFSFKNINGKIHFDEKALYIDTLDLILNNNAISAKGKSADFFPFFILPNKRVQINLATKVPHFDFENFTTPFNLGLDSSITKKKKEFVKMEYIDQLLEKGIINLQTEIGQAVYHNFMPTNVKGAILLQSNLVQLQNMNMNIADGQFNIHGQITNISNFAPKADIEVAFIDNDISKAFKAFDNFGQTDLTFKNIFGRASANINFKANINDNYVVNRNSILGDINLLISEGQLVDFPALKKLTGFLFKKRGLDNIGIDTVQTNIHLLGDHLLVDHFELHSTSFDFGVSGLYSLGDDDASRVFFEVPLSNLFKKQIKKEALGTKKSRRKGLKIYIQGKEKNDKLKFSWSIFRKRKKRKLLNKD